jgi:hypothetical protein
MDPPNHPLFTEIVVTGIFLRVSRLLFCSDGQVLLEFAPNPGHLIEGGS